MRRKQILFRISDAKVKCESHKSSVPFLLVPLIDTVTLFVIQGTFLIAHYAGSVEYSAEGFLVKNKDELPKSASELLAASDNPLIVGLSPIIGVSDSTSGAASRGSFKRSSSSVAQSSVSYQFGTQLRDLRSRISRTGPHYIR